MVTWLTSHFKIKSLVKCTEKVYAESHRDILSVYGNLPTNQSWEFFFFIIFFFYFIFYFYLRDFIFEKTLFEKLQYLNYGNYVSNSFLHAYLCSFGIVFNYIYQNIITFQLHLIPLFLSRLPVSHKFSCCVTLKGFPFKFLRPIAPQSINNFSSIPIFLFFFLRDFIFKKTLFEKPQY